MRAGPRTCSSTTCRNARRRWTTPRCAAWPLTLGRLFWRDLERHHPGHQLAAPRPRRRGRLEATDADQDHPRRGPGRQVIEIREPASSGRADLGQVRAFYLDIAQWAMEDPAAGGPGRRRGRSAARTWPGRRRSAPASRGWTSAPANGCRSCRRWRPRVHGQARASAERLAAAEAAGPGQAFTCHGDVLHRAPARSGPTARIWGEDPVHQGTPRPDRRRRPGVLDLGGGRDAARTPESASRNSPSSATTA